MCDGRHKAIWEEMQSDIQARNRAMKMIQTQIGRIDRKLFTDKENMAFLKELVENMSKEDW